MWGHHGISLGKVKTVLRGGWGMYRNQEQFNPYALAAATAQGYKTTNLQGPLTFNEIDSQSPILPPDFSAYVISPNDKVRPIYYEFNGGIDQALPGVGFCTWDLRTCQLHMSAMRV